LEKTIRELDGCKRELEIRLTNEELQPHFYNAYAEVQPHIELKGFRKGKVPIKLIKQYFGKRIEEDAVDKITNDVFKELVDKKEVKAVGEVNFEESIRTDDGLLIRLTYDTLPEFELQDYKSLTVFEPIHPVDDNEIEEQIQDLLLSNGDYNKVDEITGDKFLVTLNLFTTDKETEEILNSEQPIETKVLLYDKSVIKELKEKLMNCRKGDTFLFNPHDYEQSAPDTLYTVKVAEIEEITPLEFTNEWVQSYTQGRLVSTEEYHEEVGFEIQEKWNQKARVEMENQIINKIVGMHDFPLPDSVLKKTAKELAKDYAAKFKMNFGDNDAMLERFAQDLIPTARPMVKWEIIRNKIIEKENIEIEDFDLENFINDEVPNKDLDSGKLKKYIMENDYFKNTILTKKLMDFLLDFTTTEEIPFDDYYKKMKEQAGSEHHLHTHGDGSIHTHLDHADDEDYDDDYDDNDFDDDEESNEKTEEQEKQ